MGKEQTNLKIPNIMNSSEFKGLLPFPNYSYSDFPYVLVKDSKALTVINVRTM